MKVELDIRKTIFENANDYFQRAKKLKSKAKGARKALKNASLRAEKIKAQKVSQVQKPRKKHWYESFRWFFTSQGLLAVAGKDATTNEILVKKHVEPQDLIFHADVTGAPFTILKTEGAKPDEASLQETASFAAVYSKAWSAGIGQVEVYWVNPDQVSKEAPSGEFIPKGAFMIRGKKNYLKAQMELAIGNKEGELIWGPPQTVKAQTTRFVIIQPGDQKSKELAQAIKKRLKLDTPLDQIQRLIPTGKGRLI